VISYAFRRLFFLAAPLLSFCLEELIMNNANPSELDHWNSNTPVWVPFRQAQH